MLIVVHVTASTPGATAPSRPAVGRSWWPQASRHDAARRRDGRRLRSRTQMRAPARCRRAPGPDDLRASAGTIGRHRALASWEAAATRSMLLSMLLGTPASAAAWDNHFCFRPRRESSASGAALPSRSCAAVAVDRGRTARGRSSLGAIARRPRRGHVRAAARCRRPPSLTRHAAGVPCRPAAAQQWDPLPRRPTDDRGDRDRHARRR